MTTYDPGNEISFSFYGREWYSRDCDANLNYYPGRDPGALTIDEGNPHVYLKTGLNNSNPGDNLGLMVQRYVTSTDFDIATELFVGVTVDGYWKTHKVLFACGKHYAPNTETLECDRNNSIQILTGNGSSQALVRIGGVQTFVGIFPNYNIDYQKSVYLRIKRVGNIYNFYSSTTKPTTDSDWDFAFSWTDTTNFFTGYALEWGYIGYSGNSSTYPDTFYDIVEFGEWIGDGINIGPGPEPISNATYPFFRMG